jgi:hypothetical protein
LRQEANTIDVKLWSVVAIPSRRATGRDSRIGTRIQTLGFPKVRDEEPYVWQWLSQSSRWRQNNWISRSFWFSSVASESKISIQFSVQAISSNFSCFAK